MTRFFTPLIVSLLWVAPLRAHGPWVTLTDCRYLSNPANDGDSFHVRSGKKEYIFRLYFVDAPETEEGLGERVDEQRKYFGLTGPQVLQVGEVAKQFVEKQLARPFVVRTCMQDALGRSKKERFYAFVEIDHRDLGEELVANGLARLHGTNVQPPGMTSAEVEWRKLKQLERTAKDQKVGGWGVGVGRLNTRVESREQFDHDSFDRFFHPKRLQPSTTPKPKLRDRTAKALRELANKLSPEKKLDVNAATKEELDAIPGIGKVLAQRIVDARPFKSADDLRQVSGIGKKRYEAIRPYFN